MLLFPSVASAPSKICRGRGDVWGEGAGAGGGVCRGHFAPQLSGAEGMNSPETRARGPNPGSLLRAYKRCLDEVVNKMPSSCAEKNSNYLLSRLCL